MMLKSSVRKAITTSNKKCRISSGPMWLSGKCRAGGWARRGP
jgi:hypothetical protein